MNLISEKEIHRDGIAASGPSPYLYHAHIFPPVQMLLFSILIFSARLKLGGRLVIAP